MSKVKRSRKMFYVDTESSEVNLHTKSNQKKSETPSLGERVNFIHEKERALTDLLFGDDAPVEESSTHESDNLKHQFPKPTTISRSEKPGGEEVEEEEWNSILPTPVKRKAVWTDENDDIEVKDVMATLSRARGSRGVRETSTAKYEDSLREKFSEVYGDTPEWAKLDRETDSDEDEPDLQRKTGTYLASLDTSKKLPKTQLMFNFVDTLNKSSESEGQDINVIEFNKEYSLVLVGGSSSDKLGKATLFQFDGKKNLKIKTLIFPNFPVLSAKFLPQTHKIVIGSNVLGRFFVYDIKTGKNLDIKLKKQTNVKHFRVTPDGKYIAVVGTGGDVLFLDSVTLTLCEVVSVPCQAKGIAFHPEGAFLYVYGGNGQVYIYDLDSWRCVHSFYDDGCVEGSVIEVSPCGRFLACGDISGVVNLYDTSSVPTTKSPTPLSSFGALVTPVTSLKFNHTSEMIAIASSHKHNAIKLIHTESLTVFANFPGPFKFGYIKTVSFSPDSKYLAIGGSYSKAHLCRLLHY